MEEPGTIEEFQAYIGIRFSEPNLLRIALTHSSAKTSDQSCNERLEFLGDSILGLIISEDLYRTHPHFDEGDLTHVKSEVVSSRTLAKVGKSRGFDGFVKVGKGLKRENGLPDSLMAGVMEALFGAVFLDQGLKTARAFVLDCLDGQIENVLADRYRKNFKSLLQNHSQKHFGITPSYKVVAERGPDHGKIFEVEARLGKRRFPIGLGRTKKEAEQYAAEYAMAVLTAGSKHYLPVRISETVFPLPWARPEFFFHRVDGSRPEPPTPETGGCPGPADF